MDAIRVVLAEAKGGIDISDTVNGDAIRVVLAEAKFAAETVNTNSGWMQSVWYTLRQSIHSITAFLIATDAILGIHVEEEATCFS